MDKKAQAIADLVTPMAQAEGLSLWGCVYQPQSGRNVVQVFLDGPEGATIDACGRVHKQLAAALMVEELGHGDYALEVSSPGMDRQLFNKEQYKQYIGHELKLKTTLPIDGRRKFKGTLVSLSEDMLILKVETEEVSLPWQQIEKANVVVSW